MLVHLLLPHPHEQENYAQQQQPENASNDDADRPISPSSLGVLARLWIIIVVVHDRRPKQFEWEILVGYFVVNIICSLYGGDIIRHSDIHTHNG